MADAKSEFKELLSAYSKMSREDQREFADKLFANCNKTPEEMRAKEVEYYERYGKSLRDIGIEIACSEELSELEISEMIDLISEMDELAGQARNSTQ